MKTHELKVKIQNWNKYNNKTSWSLREDDRNFAIGDICIFRPIKDNCIYDFRIIKEIMGITKGYGLKESFCVLDLKLLATVPSVYESNENNQFIA